MANDDYWKFAESEHHFNDTQADIRKHAATWLLAAFGAIAILLKTSGNVQWVVSPAILVCTVSAMATMGLLVLWINDQLVYQRLLDAGFIIALKMEYDNPELPPIRWMMMHSAEGKGMARWMTYFYTIPMWGLLAISTTATLLRDVIQKESQGAGGNYGTLVMVLLCVAQGIAALWVQRKKKDVGGGHPAALFEDKEFQKLFAGDDDEARGQIAKVIRRYSARTTPKIGAEGEV